MKTLPTMWVNRAGQKLLINQSDFDRRTDKPWTDEKAPEPADNDKLNILNNAARSVLQQIPTIGPAAAASLIEKRPYASVEDTADALSDRQYEALLNWFTA